MKARDSMKKSIGLVIAVMIVLLIPIHTLAVDLTINETTIDAYLQEDGSVQVTELHTYEFDGEFNGITRSLIPKTGTTITNFEATENGDALEVEQEDELFRVYRGGEDEVITIELSYLIHQGVDVYEDMAQFYWPFFDSGNESDYEHMTITVYPPEATNDVLAYGSDEAYETEKIRDDGSVVFAMGFVNSGKDGNIRVAYDSALFPSVTLRSNETIREEIIDDQQAIAEDKVNYQNRQETINNIAALPVGIFGSFLIGLLLFAWRKKHTTDYEADRIYHSTSIVPKGIMSMPATIYFYRNYLLDHGLLLTIGMMDLVRKGNIEAKEDETYRYIDSRTERRHEDLLLDLLFNKVEKSDTFTFEQLKDYTTANQSSFSLAIHDYQKEMLDEINSHNLYDKHKKLRWTTALLSLLLIPLMILFGIFQLFMWLFISLGIMIALLVFAIGFNPKTPEGKMIKKRWKQLEEEFGELEKANWESLTSDDKERALLFSAGLLNKKLKEKNKAFIDSYDNTQDNTAFTLLMLFTLSTTANTNFGEATQVSASSSSSGSSFTGTGTGVGGGGGGSGGF